MAETMTGMLVEETLVTGTGAKHGHGQRVRAYGVVAALLVALLIGSVAIHNRQASHTAAPAIPGSVTTRAERTFLENNTTNLPNAVTAETLPVVSSVRQNFLDLNTTWLPVGTAEVAPSAVICPTELTDRPLCYTLLSDGTKVLASVRPDWPGQP